MTSLRFTRSGFTSRRGLAERIITSKTALEGERKQVTVLFADLKGSMELLADRDPEEARKLLDPVLELMMEAVHRYEGTVYTAIGQTTHLAARMDQSALPGSCSPRTRCAWPRASIVWLPHGKAG
jgi:class 3 adenylate cyclase